MFTIIFLLIALISNTGINFLMPQAVLAQVSVAPITTSPENPAVIESLSPTLFLTGFVEGADCYVYSILSANGEGVYLSPCVNTFSPRPGNGEEYVPSYFVPPGVLMPETLYSFVAAACKKLEREKKEEKIYAEEGLICSDFSENPLYFSVSPTAQMPSPPFPSPLPSTDDLNPPKPNSSKNSLKRIFGKIKNLFLSPSQIPLTFDLKASKDTGISNDDNITKLSDLVIYGTAPKGYKVRLFDETDVCNPAPAHFAAVNSGRYFADSQIGETITEIATKSKDILRADRAEAAEFCVPELSDPSDPNSPMVCIAPKCIELNQTIFVATPSPHCEEPIPVPPNIDFELYDYGTRIESAKLIVPPHCGVQLSWYISGNAKKFCQANSIPFNPEFSWSAPPFTASTYADSIYIHNPTQNQEFALTCESSKSTLENPLITTAKAELIIDNSVGETTSHILFGSWEVPVKLAEGSHKIRAQIIDQSGNQSSLSDPLTIIVDQHGPVVDMVPIIKAGIPIAYTLSEDIVVSGANQETFTDGMFTLKWKSGVPDPTNSRNCRLGGNFAKAGVHNLNFPNDCGTPTPFPLTNGTIYDIFFGGKDLAGNGAVVKFKAPLRVAVPYFCGKLDSTCSYAFVAPDDVYRLDIEAQGGGGGGQSGETSEGYAIMISGVGGAGGAAGESSNINSLLINPGDYLEVEVGAGGSGSPAISKWQKDREGKPGKNSVVKKGNSAVLSALGGCGTTVSSQCYNGLPGSPGQGGFTATNPSVGTSLKGGSGGMGGGNNVNPCPIRGPGGFGGSGQGSQSGFPGSDGQCAGGGGGGGGGGVKRISSVPFFTPPIEYAMGGSGGNGGSGNVTIYYYTYFNPTYSIFSGLGLNPAVAEETNNKVECDASQGFCAYTIPQGATKISIEAIGGGGGGGGGGYAVNSNPDYGGGGGGGGGMGGYEFKGFDISFLAYGNDIHLYPGAGGEGGAGATTTSHSQDGVDGKPSYALFKGEPLVAVSGGNGGKRGTNASRTCNGVIINDACYCFDPATCFTGHSGSGGAGGIGAGYGGSGGSQAGGGGGGGRGYVETPISIGPLKIDGGGGSSGTGGFGGKGGYVPLAPWAWGPGIKNCNHFAGDGGDGASYGDVSDPGSNGSCGGGGGGGGGGSRIDGAKGPGKAGGTGGSGKIIIYTKF